MMDLPWGDEKTRKFVTNVGLITSNGPHGHNIMAAEWTHHISYEPGIISVHVGFDRATNDNIRKTGEFGVSLAADDQNVVSSVAGGSSGKDTDKLRVLKELGVEFYKAKKIDVMMVNEASMNAECKVIKTMDLGNKTMFVGEVVEASSGNKPPLAYHDGKYWKLNNQIEKPSPEIRDRIQKVVEKYKK